MAKMNEEVYRWAQTFFGAKTPKNDEGASGKIFDMIAAAVKESGEAAPAKASEWLREKAAIAIEAARQPQIADDLAGEEAPAGPTPEQIEAARQAVSDAEKFVEMCEKFDTGVADAKVKLVEARKQLAELAGDEEEEEAEVPLPVLPAQGAIVKTGAGYVDLDKDTRSVFASLPWERESGRDGKPRQSVFCRVETGYAPETFIRVWGALNGGQANRALQSGKLGLRFIQDKDAESGRDYVIWVFHPEFRPGGTTNPNVRTKIQLGDDGKLYAHGQSAMAVTLVGVGQPSSQATGVSLIGAKGPR